MHLLVGFRLLIANIRSFYKKIVNVHNYSGVIVKLLDEKSMADLHVIERSNFCLGCQNFSSDPG